jgi:hypothetical protein
MGELVAFRPQGRGPHSPLRDADESAEILFFTGVRFARLEEYHVQPKRRRSAPRRQGQNRAERP